MAEGEIHVPRLGGSSRAPTFRLIAEMNPFDAIGTARVGQAIYDRMCRIAIGYADADGERRIVERVTGLDGPDRRRGRASGARDPHAPRPHGRLVGPGAIDLVLLASGLGAVHSADPTGREALRDAAHAALSGRVRVEDGCDRTAEGSSTPCSTTGSRPRTPTRRESPGPVPPGTGAFTKAAPPAVR